MKSTLIPERHHPALDVGNLLLKNMFLAECIVQTAVMDLMTKMIQLTNMNL